MISHILLTISIFIFSLWGSRYSFPYPASEYTVLFVLLFSFGFFPNFLYRRWGRIFTIIGGLCLVRLGSFSNGLTTIPDWTSLQPLFWGAVFGILAREVLLDLLGRKKSQYSQGERDPLLRRFILNPSPGKKGSLWKEPELWFILFFFILILERFLTYHPWSWQTGIILDEGFYFPGLSYRQAFQLSWMLWDTIIPVTFYILTEERFSKDGDNPARAWTIGLGVAFLIQVIIILLQSWVAPLVFMQNTNESILNGRVAGLFRDSGSASWILPTLGLYLVWKAWEKKGIWRERTRIFFIVGVLILTTVSGIKLGRTFWLVFLPGLLTFLMIPFWKKQMSYNKYIQITYRVFLILFVTMIGFSIVWFGENQKSIQALSRLSLEVKSWVNTDSSLEIFGIYRLNLLLASWKLFISSPYFGSGIGSLIVHLKDPSLIDLPRPPKGFVDSPANFYIGWLGDVGVLGGFLLAFFLGVTAYIRKNGRYFILLLLPLMTGYQIVHPDGGFFFIFLVLGTRRMEISKASFLTYYEKSRLLWMILAIGISFHYLAWVLLRNP